MIGEAGFPLQKLSLRKYHHTRSTYNGMLILLSNCRSTLQHLSLYHFDFTDDIMHRLCAHIEELRSVRLSSCKKITSATFFHLLRSCPFLGEIVMDCTTLFKSDQDIINAREFPNVRSLIFANDHSLKDKHLERIAQAFPELRKLQLVFVDFDKTCHIQPKQKIMCRRGGVAEAGIAYFQEFCKSITELTLQKKNVGRMGNFFHLIFLDVSL